MDKPRCILTVDVEAFPRRAPDRHVDTLIYGHFGRETWGIGRMMDVADKHSIKMTFFLDFAEVELYGDQIIDIGRYILDRGHDLQIHCHYELLAQKILNRFPGVDRSYYTWYQNKEISAFIIDYCLEQYRKCTQKMPLAFRGGAYRFGAPLLKVLKEKGFKADATYNALRPKPLPVSKQFFYENGLLELPIGIVPERKSKPAKLMSFNSDLLFPVTEKDQAQNLATYKEMFADFYDHHGCDAVASLMMHSWSFCWDEERVQTAGYFDRPNLFAANLFNNLLDMSKKHIAFITAEQAVRTECNKSLDTVNFSTAFSLQGLHSTENIRRAAVFIQKKAKGRDVVIWGRGWLETEIMESFDVAEFLSVKFYISRDAAYNRAWRGRPVKTFDEARLSPAEHYVFLCAQTTFPEIREMLRNAGFVERDDFYDFEKHSVSED